MFLKEKYHLIGDSAFGLKAWLMTPYRDVNLTRIQRRHNYSLSSSRVAIEHAFGLLKGRWRRLIFVNTNNISKTIEITTAALVLHNFCIMNVDLWDEEYRDEPEHKELKIGAVQIEQAGRTKRDQSLNYQ